MEQQLISFGLQSFMDNITFVTDRGSNFIKAFRSNKVLLCVAHRMNNILKRCFYQNPAKKSQSLSSKASHSSTIVMNLEATPAKKKVAVAVPADSPEMEENECGGNEEES